MKKSKKILIDLIHAVLICVFVLVLAWSLYHLPIITVGFVHLRRSSKKFGKMFFADVNPPNFSIIVPAKNEAKVIGRLLDALLRLNYPKDKFEVIVVVDGSTDNTFKICARYAEEHGENIRVVCKPVSDGKPSALNYGLKHAKGEIIGIFDADSIPEGNVLTSVCKYFRDSEVAAVQGRNFSMNAEENRLTKLISYEESVWCETFLRGKDVLDLFVHLKGSCQFIRRDVLEQLGGFDGKALSEDMDLSVRLVERGYKIKYASDVRSWQETPSRVGQLFKQRTRWFRGTMEVALKYGKLMTRPTKKNFDAELTLLGPFILVASLVSYLLAFYASFAAFQFDFMLQFLMQLSVLGTSITLIVCGLALAYISKPRRLTNVLWLPFMYFYWSLQAFIALYAVMLIILRRPRIWVKTDKKGTMTRALVH